MSLRIAEQVLTVYSWLVIGALLVFLWHIARFYADKSGQQVGHRLLILPAVLLTGGVIWYLVHDASFVGRPAGDMLLFTGGVLLFVFSERLQKLMMRE